MGVANYDVAVMNYPLFEKGRLSGEEANKLFARPRYTDIGRSVARILVYPYSFLR